MDPLFNCTKRHAYAKNRLDFDFLDEIFTWRNPFGEFHIFRSSNFELKEKAQNKVAQKYEPIWFQLKIGDCNLI